MSTGPKIILVGARALTDRVARVVVRKPSVASEVFSFGTSVIPNLLPTVDASEADAGTVAAARSTIRIPVHERLARTANVTVEVGP